MVHLYQLCDRGMSGMVWPDGGAVIDQPVKLIEAFNAIAYGFSKAPKRTEPGG